MKSYRPDKSQIHGRENSKTRDAQWRKLAQHDPKKSKIRVSKKAAHIDPHINIDFRRAKWALFIFLVIIIPGILINARWMRGLAKAYNNTDRLSPPVANDQCLPRGIANAEVCELDEAKYQTAEKMLERYRGAGFFQMKVENPCKFGIYDDPAVFSQPNINIITKTHDPRALPHSDVDALDPKKNSVLTSAGISRDPHTRVVLRSDTRSMEQISEAGGFRPKNFNPEKKIILGSNPLDLINHRKGGTDGSGFVSTTVSQRIAHRFGASHPSYTVYSLLATGAMTPATAGGLYDFEVEYSAPGGIDKQDIIAYRECEKKYLAVCSDIHVNSMFAKKHPDLVDDVINTQLVCDEKISP